jgi:hypothetical protein
MEGIFIIKNTNNNANKNATISIFGIMRISAITKILNIKKLFT